MKRVSVWGRGTGRNNTWKPSYLTPPHTYWSLLSFLILSSCCKLQLLHITNKLITMRSEGNPLDLNNLPEEYGKHVGEESSTTTAASTESSRIKKKKKEGKDEIGKIYECRFCSLKFCKSQALGGHMNRHRQERETETLNRARQLVFSNDNINGAHMGLRDLNFGSSIQSMSSSCFQQVRNMGFQSTYPRIPAPPITHHLQSYIYTSPSSNPYQSSYPPPPPPPPPMSDYYIGRALVSDGTRPPLGKREGPSLTIAMDEGN